MKHYFASKDSELCYPKEYFDTIMQLDELKAILVFEAIPDEMPDGHFFCKAYEEFSETGICGKDCKFYQPRNGKSGCCVHFSKRAFTPADEPTILKP